MNRKRLFRPPIVSAVLACWVVLLASCSTPFKEKYYIGVYKHGAKADEHEAGPTQFYRFRLEGWATWLSKTRYEAGWYDASVVDRLFGEIRPKVSILTGEVPDASKAPIKKNSRPDATGEVREDDETAPEDSGNSVVPSTTPTVEPATQDGKTVEPPYPRSEFFVHFGPEGLGSTQRTDERFVIFMSANPRVLVNRIRALVNSERTQSVIATALITPRLVKEKTKIQEAQLDTTRAKKLADEAKKFVGADEFKEASPAELKVKVADWLGQLGSGPLGVLSLLQEENQTPEKDQGDG